MTRPGFQDRTGQGKEKGDVILEEEQEEGQLVAGILSALTEALGRCEGQRHAWTRRNLRRAMVLIGGLDEKVVQEIIEQEGP